MEYIKDQSFKKTDFTGLDVSDEYDHCQFINCNFTESNMSEARFSNCEFLYCDLSLAKLHKTSFQDVLFRECKMLGIRFDVCNKLVLSFRFEDCNLSHSVFYQLKIKKTSFIHCKLKEADFNLCDLSESVFEDCDLERAVFNYTNLEKADLRSAFNYSIDPENNRIRKAKFSIEGVRGLLDKYGIIIE